MNKKVWLGFIAVFITLEVLDFIVHGVILASTYASITVWRPDMMSKIWITHLVTFIGAFFFAFIFSKGYENKGIVEGLRYGLYLGIWMSVGMAYGTYAMIAIPYPLPWNGFSSASSSMFSRAQFSLLCLARSRKSRQKFEAESPRCNNKPRQLSRGLLFDGPSIVLPTQEAPRSITENAEEDPHNDQHPRHRHQQPGDFFRYLNKDQESSEKGKVADGVNEI